MARYLDAWRGYQLEYPDGWRVLFPPLDDCVAFDAPDSSCFLEFSTVAAPDARTAIENRLRRFPPHEARQLSGDRHQAGIAFRQERAEGQLHARWSEGRAMLVLAQHQPGLNLDLHPLVAHLTGSLQPIAPVPRQSWQEPSEHAFSLQIPTGWQVQSALKPTAVAREVLARVSLSAQTMVAFEPSMQPFVHGPAEVPGEVSMPFDGLRPALHHFFLPRWGRVELLSFEDFGNPKRAEVRLRLPDGVLQVIRLGALPLPNSHRWVGGVECYYQAPAAEMERWEAVLRGIQESARMSPQWQARENQLRQQQAQFQAQQNLQNQQQWMNLQNNLHQQRMHDISMQGQHNTWMHQQRMDMADMQFQGYQQTSHSMDQRHHDTINSIREHSDYFDPRSGKMHNLADGPERVWSDPSGNLFGGNWSVQPPADWQELRRMRPGEWHD